MSDDDIETVKNTTTKEQKREHKDTKETDKIERGEAKTEFVEIREVKIMIEAVKKFIEEKKGGLDIANPVNKKLIERKIRDAEEIYKLLKEFLLTLQNSIMIRKKLIGYIEKERSRRAIRKEEKNVEGNEITETKEEEGQNAGYNVDVNYS